MMDWNHSELDNDLLLRRVKKLEETNEQRRSSTDEVTKLKRRIDDLEYRIQELENDR